MVNDIKKRERELFNETYKLRQANFEVAKKEKNKKKSFKIARKLQEQENEMYKKHQFFKNYIKEMEKRKKC